MTPLQRALILLALLFATNSAFAACSGLTWGVEICDTKSEAFDRATATAKGHTAVGYFHWVTFEDVGGPTTLNSNTYYGRYACKQTNADGALIGCAAGNKIVWRAMANGCTASGGVVTCARDQDPGRAAGCPACPVGNPIDAASGNKHQEEVDFVLGDLLEYRRYYNSKSVSRFSGAGIHWTHSYSARVEKSSSTLAFAHRADGQRLRFTRATANDPWAPDSDISSALVELVDGSGVTTGWTFSAVDAREVESFDQLGRLASIQRADGASLSLIHNGGVIEGNRDDFLVTRITNHKNRSINVAYNGLEQITSVTMPDGRAFTYLYDSRGRAVKAQGPDGTFRTYQYNESAYTGGRNIGEALTGITDEAGVRFAIFEYGEFGDAVGTRHAAGADAYQLVLNANATTDVTTPEGAVTTVTFTNAFAPLKPTAISKSCAGCTTRTTTLTYDSNGYRDVVTDPLGVATNYDHNSRGLVEQRVDAANDGTGSRRTIEHDWHSTLAVPTERRTYDDSSILVAKDSWTYNARGQPTSGSAIDPATLATRTTTYTYCEVADASIPGSTCPIVGLLKSVDGPRNDVADVAQYSYRSADDLSGCATAGICHRKGDLWGIVDPFGNEALIQRRDLAGRVTQVRDGNLVVTDIEYDARGRLVARKVRGSNDSTEVDDAITRIEYAATGQAHKVTQPDGSFVLFDYDAAHRLTGIEDALGNTMTYSLDSAGNRFQEQIKDDASVLRYTLARVFNKLGEMETAADAFANPTDFVYDLGGNIQSDTDALGRTTDNDYDALGRLRQSIANVAGSGGEQAVSMFDYDALDRLTAVVDPKGLTTQYVYDGLGNLAQLQSPDTGTATFGHDSAGNRTSALDARGIETSYVYDRLNRLTLIDVPTAGQDVALDYDTLPVACQAEETFSIGRLSSITDPSGSTTYCHDRRGNVVRKVQAVTGGPTGTVGYSYNSADRLVAMTYPSGATIALGRDATGRINGILAQPTPGSAPVTLVSGVEYAPFGPLSRLTFGNGRQLDRAHDLNYGIDAVTDSAPDGVAINYGLDDIGNITALDERLKTGAAANRVVEYDGLDRLAALKDGSTTLQGFSYDATGNRLQKADASTDGYTYDPTSHRLTQAGSVARTYDAAGHGTGIGAKTFSYDDHGRRVQYLDAGVLAREYRYNGRGERVAKLVTAAPENDLTFVYDEAGHLIGEYRADGTRIREFVWMDDVPVAVLMDSGTTHYYIASDHLNTPRAVIKPSTNTIIWRWDLTGSAFGDHAVDNDPDGDGAVFDLALRYPGQYYDGETGTHYNYFRDYDPSTGRYLQSDPIGLFGGPSTFSYGNSNPLGAIDPYGLAVQAAYWNPGMVGRSAGQVLGRSAPGGAMAAGWLAGGAISERYEANGSSIGGDLYETHRVAAEGLEIYFNLSASSAGGNRRQEMYDDYKYVLNLPKNGPDGDRCKDLLWQIARARVGLNLRLGWDALFSPGGHSGDIVSLQNGLLKKVKQYERECGPVCPL